MLLRDYRQVIENYNIHHDSLLSVINHLSQITCSHVLTEKLLYKNVFNAQLSWERTHIKSDGILKKKQDSAVGVKSYNTINGCHCVKLKILTMYSLVKKTYDSQSEKAQRSYGEKNYRKKKNFMKNKIKFHFSISNENFCFLVVFLGESRKILFYQHKKRIFFFKLWLYLLFQSYFRMKN